MTLKPFGVSTCMRCAGALALVLARPVAAATNDMPVSQVSTSLAIMVTARKWVEPLQEVPAAVTVRAAGELAATGASDLRDAARAVPNLTLGEFTARRLTFPYVRGIGSGQNAPAVMTCIDGVPQLSYVTANQQLLDVERIEFLRGPQGSLYGRDALGGVINIVPRLPTRTPARALAFSTGSPGLYEGRLTTQGPLGDAGLLGSFGLGYATRDGYTKNDFTGHDLDSREAWFGRAQLYLPEQGAWRYRLSLTAERDRDGDYAFSDLAGIRARPHHAAHDYEGHNDRDLAQPVLTAQRQGDDVDFVSITAFQWWQTRDSTDLDYTPADLMRKESEENEHAWVQELRLSSPAAAPIRLGDRMAMHWLGGAAAFIQNNERHAVTDYRPGGVSYGLWTYPMQMQNDAQLDNLSASLFGQTTFVLDERWELGLGLRGDFEHRSAEVSSGMPAGPALASSDPSRNFNQVSPRASLGRRFDPGIFAYTAVSKGYRAGGFNAVSPLDRTSYDEESCWNYEAGLKTDFFDHRLTAAATLFRLDWEEIQVNTHVPGGNASDYYIENGGQARSQGAEFELNARPLQGLELFGGAGWVDAAYRDGSHSADQDVSGNDLPFAPRFGWHAGSAYTRQLAAKLRAFARLDVVGTGRYYYDASNFESQPSFVLVDARLGVEAGAWRVEGWVKNLFDEAVVPLAIPYGQGAAGRPVYMGENGAPRTLGISLTRAF